MKSLIESHERLRLDLMKHIYTLIRDYDDRLIGENVSQKVWSILWPYFANFEAQYELKYNVINNAIRGDL